MQKMQAKAANKSGFAGLCGLLLLLGAGTVVGTGCSMPRVPGFGGYYAVTDPATGKVYYTDQVRREDRESVEFRDDATGSWISLSAAEVRDISREEYKANTGR